ncbi:MAG UNVERIFIED_CONTAM: hypothetical protein LVT10_09560 [Anaerolineae bacterium]
MPNGDAATALGAIARLRRVERDGRRTGTRYRFEAIARLRLGWGDGCQTGTRYRSVAIAHLRRGRAGRVPNGDVALPL